MIHPSLLPNPLIEAFPLFSFPRYSPLSSISNGRAKGGDNKTGDNKASRNTVLRAAAFVRGNASVTAFLFALIPFLHFLTFTLPYFNLKASRLCRLVFLHV